MIRIARVASSSTSRRGRTTGPTTRSPIGSAEPSRSRHRRLRPRQRLRRSRNRRRLPNQSQNRRRSQRRPPSHRPRLRPSRRRPSPMSSCFSRQPRTSPRRRPPPHRPPRPRAPSLPRLPRLSSLPFFKRQAAAPPRRTAVPSSAPSLPSPSAKRQPAAQAPANPPAPAPVAAPHAQLTHLDQVADSLSRAVRTFGDRAALFDRRQLACDGLARGLLAVEDRWLSYSRARRASAALDPTHAARDQTLYAGVDSVERRFEKSGCQRP